MQRSTHHITLSTLILLLGLTAYAQNEPEEQPYWVFFHDKEVADAVTFDPADHEFGHLSQRALERRLLRGTSTGPGFADLPVPEAYIQEILGPEVKLRMVSRWLNAVSVITTPSGIETLAGNSIVKKTKRIHKVSKRVIQRNTRDEEVFLTDAVYGASYDQNLQINAVEAHNQGYTGSDVWLLMLDTGYFTEHAVFQPERIVAEYDFIQGDSVTSNEAGESPYQHNHGTASASVAGGRLDGEFRGSAFNCRFLLAKTEMVDEEIQVEEDYYIAALEWGEALGADIVSSSLGYLDWYDYEDMDGETAVTTQGIDHAVGLGMVCVTAAGNEGNTDWGYIIAPADADSVISVGAVTADNVVAGFSSHGPTYDGRIKPEVMARGVATYLADTDSIQAFSVGSGTSFATPLVAGAAALILEANPNWSPMMVREALMMTAHKSTSPNNTHGFGLIDVMAAISYDFGVVQGDVNSDSELNVSDAVLLLEWVLQDTELVEEQFEVADVNNDNRVDILDIVVLVEWILSL